MTVEDYLAQLLLYYGSDHYLWDLAHRITRGDQEARSLLADSLERDHPWCEITLGIVHQLRRER